MRGAIIILITNIKSPGAPTSSISLLSALGTPPRGGWFHFYSQPFRMLDTSGSTQRKRPKELAAKKEEEKYTVGRDLPQGVHASHQSLLRSRRPTPSPSDFNSPQQQLNACGLPVPVPDI
jgi:hypothetical protein